MPFAAHTAYLDASHWCRLWLPPLAPVLRVDNVSIQGSRGIGSCSTPTRHLPGTPISFKSPAPALGRCTPP
jgi:hypothetical protein